MDCTGVSININLIYIINHKGVLNVLVLKNIMTKNILKLKIRN